MQTLDVALDHLRGTLLAACGLGVLACTPTTPATEQEPTVEARTEPIVEAEPKAKPIPIAACEGSQAVMDGDKATGYVRCADGAINREQGLACPNPIDVPACKGDEQDRMCQTDADCTDRPHGFCGSQKGQRGPFCGCLYPCLSDAECGANEACMCPNVNGNMVVSQCAPAECKTNEDCPSGQCGATYFFNGCRYQLSLQCRDAEDACRGESDCPEFQQCAAFEGDVAAAFRCSPLTCVIGRPLTVEGGVRVANVADRTWGSTRLVGLAPERARAEYWLGIARMEHASVASFARFVQELLRFGAPPELLTDALAAAADEVRHAEQTFALASAYGCEPLGPGALRVDDLRPTTDLEVFVTRLISEGCVGETLGVAEALALLEHELDPALRPRLEQIAADETRHAALAWRTLKWIGNRVDSTIIERAFEQAIAQAMRVDDEAVDPAHGRLGTRAKAHARAEALASVIEPCRDQLRFTSNPARAWQRRPS